MLHVLDSATLNLTLALKRSGQWENTLILWMSDNGGIGLGNKYVLFSLSLYSLSHFLSLSLSIISHTRTHSHQTKAILFEDINMTLGKEELEV